MKHSTHFIRRSTAILALGFSFVAVAGAKPAIHTQLPDSVPAAVAQSLIVGAPDSSTVLHLAIGLTPSSQAGLDAFVASVSDPKSPNYRHFASSEQIGENYGAALVDVNNVVSFLKSNGFTVTLVAENRMSILADATVSQIQTAFGTKVENFVGADYMGKPIAYYANATPLSVPANLAGVIQCVAGVDNFLRPIRRTTLTPSQERTLYATQPAYSAGFTGAGASIGFSNWDGYKVSNAQDFISYFGLPVPSGGSGSNIFRVSIGGANNSNTNGAGEGDLDLQMELSSAPLANIYVYDGSQSAANPLATYTTEANNNTADIISESYGWPTMNANTAQSCHNEIATMVGHGQTYMCASGDSGTSDFNTYGWPDVDPNLSNVGGTMATVNSSGNRTSEVTWNGSGGGWSTLSYGTTNFNVLPAWQVGTGVPTNINFRLVPDVAAQAQSGNDAAVYIFYDGSLSEIAGTSAASPWFCSGLSTVEQQLAAAGQTRRLGNINPMIYGWNGNATAFYDITSGSGNGNLPNGHASNPTAGWDFVTGWGAPVFSGWLNLIAPQSATFVPTSFSLFRGVLDAGNLASLAAIDQNYLQGSPGPTLNAGEQPLELIVNGTCPVSSVVSLKFTLTAHGASGTVQEVDVYNWTTSSFQTVSTQATSTSDSTVTVTLTNPNQFIQAGTNAVQARIQYKATGPTLQFPWNIYIDQTAWIETP